MPSSSGGSRPIALDASFALGLVVEGPLSEACSERMKEWAREDRALVAPDFWLAEAVSALRKLAFHNALTDAQAARAVDDLFTLGVEPVPVSARLCHRALTWSAELAQAKAYDALYLAVAEAHEAELWTLDRRLADRARQIEVDWVHSPAAETP